MQHSVSDSPPSPSHPSTCGCVVPLPWLQVCLQFLNNLIHTGFKSQQVKGGDKVRSSVRHAPPARHSCCLRLHTWLNHRRYFVKNDLRCHNTYRCPWCSATGVMRCYPLVVSICH